MKLTNLKYVLVVLAVTGLAVFAAQAKDKDKLEKQLKEVQSVGSTLEVHMTDNGKVLVRGAKVTSVSGSTINASTEWGSAKMNWAVATDANTELLRRHSGKAVLADIKVGDIISFQGLLDMSVGSPITVKAKIVKNWSLDKQVQMRTTLEGKIKTLPGSTLPSNMVITSGNKDYSVKISSGTSILNVLWLSTNLTGFHVGDKVRVYGEVKTDLSVDATVVRNVSLGL